MTFPPDVFPLSPLFQLISFTQLFFHSPNILFILHVLTYIGVKRLQVNLVFQLIKVHFYVFLFESFHMFLFYDNYFHQSILFCCQNGNYVTLIVHILLILFHSRYFLCCIYLCCNLHTTMNYVCLVHNFFHLTVVKHLLALVYQVQFHSLY